jgi:hypothetical protein
MAQPEHPEHPEHPHEGGPPGQNPERIPPGQDKPDEETDEDLEPTHPIVDPDAPYIEHHDEDESTGAPA